MNYRLVESERQKQMAHTGAIQQEKHVIHNRHHEDANCAFPGCHFHSSSLPFFASPHSYSLGVSIQWRPVRPTEQRHYSGDTLGIRPIKQRWETSELIEFSRVKVSKGSRTEQRMWLKDMNSSHSHVNTGTTQWLCTPFGLSYFAEGAPHAKKKQNTTGTHYTGPLITLTCSFLFVVVIG